MKRNLPKGCVVVIEAERNDNGDWRCVLDKPLTRMPIGLYRVVQISCDKDIWWWTWRYPQSVDGCLVVFEGRIVSHRDVKPGDLFYQLPDEENSRPSLYKRWSERLYDGEYDDALTKIFNRYSYHGTTQLYDKY